MFNNKIFGIGLLILVFIVGNHWYVNHYSKGMNQIDLIFVIVALLFFAYGVFKSKKITSK